MMKRLAILSLAILFAGIQAETVIADELGAKPYGEGPGCGLGAQVFKDGPKTMLHQSMAATTNVVFSQTFAITTGTWGCTNNGKFVSIEHATLFANLNFDNLSQEMAQGGGEHLASLAVILGVPAEQQPEFFALTQEKYPSLMRAGEESPAAMIKTLDDAMAAHPVLVKVSMAR
ncbi:MAG: DUF3015 family protein [Nitrospiraceae bacterium]